METALEVVHRPDHQRYEILTDGRVAGFVSYHDGDGYLVLDHTEVLAAHEGQGLAGQLARGTFEDLRARGLQAQPQCQFMASWVDKHSEYADLVVPVDEG